MMYFFKTLACFNLLKVQVLHMLCTLKLKGVLHFPLKWPLSNVVLLATHVCDSPSPCFAGMSGCRCSVWFLGAALPSPGLKQNCEGNRWSTASGWDWNCSDMVSVLSKNPTCALGEGEEEVLQNNVSIASWLFCSSSNTTKYWVFEKNKTKLPFFC